MDCLQSVQALIVQQKKEWGEILTNFETKNKYVIVDTSGQELLYAFEEAGFFLLRLLLKAYRPFTLSIATLTGERLLRLHRPFRFFLSCMDVHDRQGVKIGTIKRQFAILKRCYTVYNADGVPLMQLEGPLLHPWTFHIVKDGARAGVISKKWSGLGKELFTDADNFSLQFPSDLDNTTKSILLGAVFLIDFVHVENKK